MCNMIFLHIKLESDAKAFSAGEEVLYGTTDGKIGLVNLGMDSASTKWEIDNDKKKGGVLFARPNLNKNHKLS